MTNQTLDTYYSRMSSSLGDKARVLDYVVGSRVLDVGCGSGDLLGVLLGEGYDAYGVDVSCESLGRNEHPGRVFMSYADDLHSVFDESFAFDTVICSSVFHEVFSYGNFSYEHGMRVGRIESVADALRSAYRMLKPGGRLIIRDGVAPRTTGLKSMIIDDIEFLFKFNAASPFTSAGFDRTISLDRGLGSNEVVGSESSLMELAFTYTWGPESFEREVQEFYGLFTLHGYADFVQRFGFECVEKFSYIQPGYVEHLAGKVTFLGMNFPDTNALWVYDKIAKVRNG